LVSVKVLAKSCCTSALKEIISSFSLQFFCGDIKSLCYSPHFSFLFIIYYYLIEINLYYWLNIRNRSFEAAKAFLCHWDRRQSCQASETCCWKNKNSYFRLRNLRNSLHPKILCFNYFYSNLLSKYQLIHLHHFFQSYFLILSNYAPQKALEKEEIFFLH
jgi:hypothetical protein